MDSAAKGKSSIQVGNLTSNFQPFN